MKNQVVFGFVTFVCCVLIFFGQSDPICAQSFSEKTWKVTVQTGRFGPVESVLAFEKRDNGFYIHSVSVTPAVIKKFPRTQTPKVTIGDHLLAFTVTSTSEGYQGEMKSPWVSGKIFLKPTDDGFTGKIEGGPLSGKMTGVPYESPNKSLRDYPAILKSFLNVVETRVYAPKALKDPAWKQLTNDLTSVASIALDDMDLVLGFHFAYDNKPFSHLTFSRGRGPAKELIASLDQYRVGGTPVSIKVVDNIALLRVKTMLGIDTEEQIEDAFHQIADQSAKALIIDVRGNGGGAFAIKPLIQHVIDTPLDAGYFLTHKWNLGQDRLPTKPELLKVTPWKGFSLKSWWENIQTEGIIRIRFEPDQLNFNGPVYLLIDSQSASATELAADVLSTSGVVTLVGERTGGKMLSQSPFDVSDGFQVFVPVADYYSLATGRIEGVGVKPHVEVKSPDALDTAMNLARKAIVK